ncbi:MAG: flagellar hook-basal body complex protein FliE [Planctomycetes bacterium]|nr:flagellar hook-basal body complex protein FliE [Planctomycetota bacterium]
MSNFDLPPLLGFDPMARGAFRPLGAEAMAQRPQLVGEPSVAGVPDVGDPSATQPSAFGGALDAAVSRMNSLQTDVTRKVQGLVLGEGVELHDVMLAIDKSEVSFNLMLEVRNKLVDAWEKLSRSVS